MGPWAHASAACVAFAPVLLFPLLSTNFYTTIATHLAFVVAWLAVRGVASSGWALAAGVGITHVLLVVGLWLMIFQPGGSEFTT